MIIHLRWGYCSPCGARTNRSRCGAHALNTENSRAAEVALLFFYYVFLAERGRN